MKRIRELRVLYLRLDSYWLNHICPFLLRDVERRLFRIHSYKYTAGDIL